MTKDEKNERKAHEEVIENGGSVLINGEVISSLDRLGEVYGDKPKAEPKEEAEAEKPKAEPKK